ncbi:LysE family translocator [Actinomyces procaprae]|uniref:LysE family translocator n=1 Tax=Actinomyces procaprae TaxID=2560010 RepID=UPI00109DBFDA|nr:LysE family translocator [Actinomyces procaprae]
MTLPQALIGFAAIVVVLTLVPGLDTAVVLRGALNHSRGYGLATVAGIFTGLIVWGAAAGVGATAVLAASSTAYRLLSLAGALYLAWMGAGMLLRSFSRGSRSRSAIGARAGAPQVGTAAGDASTATGAGAAAGGGAPLWRGWLTGLATDLLNPKAGVFYLATIPQFMAVGVPPLLMGVLLAAVHGLCCVVWMGALAVGAAWIAPRLESGAGAALERWTDRVTGGVLLGFGTKLALDARV